jgi:hypothetical protein
VDHLVVAPQPQPLSSTEICDGRELDQPDWGPNGQLLALTVGFDQNDLVVCDVLPAIPGNATDSTQTFTTVSKVRMQWAHY